MGWYLKVLRQYADLSGRARRKEYWTWFLVNLVILFVLFGVEQAVGLGSDANYGPLSGLYTLAVFLPWLGVTVRRLHDTGRSGWWIFVQFIPVIGFLVILFFLIQDGDTGPNDFGPDPKAQPEPA